MKRTHQIAALALGFAAGIILQANLGLKVSAWMLAIAAAIALAAIFGAKKLIALALIPFSLLAGALYFQNWQAHYNAHNVSQFIGQRVTLTGQATGTPAWSDIGQYQYTLTHLQTDGHQLTGKLRVSSQLGNVQEGYRAQVTGKLYHSVSSDAQMIYVDAQVISRQQPWLIRAKDSFRRGLSVALPQPANQLMEGLVIGNRSTLPKPIQDELNAIGLSHIVAVSGYNLTILIMLYHALARSRWQWLNLVSSLWLIAGFVVLTGAVASIVRAGIMTALFLLCRYYGKRLSVGSCLLLTGVITLLMNPSYILSDLGWRLSFASLAGIVLLTEPIAKLLPKKLPKLSLIIAATLAAQIVTLPLIAFSFGQFSLIAPLANLLVLPTIPVLMAAGIAAGLVGMLLPNAAAVLFLPLSFACRWLLNLIHWLSTRPFAALDVTTPRLSVLLGYYAAIIAGWWLSLRARPALRYNKAHADNGV